MHWGPLFASLSFPTHFLTLALSFISPLQVKLLHFHPYSAAISSCQLWGHLTCSVFMLWLTSRQKGFLFTCNKVQNANLKPSVSKRGRKRKKKKTSKVKQLIHHWKSEEITIFSTLILLTGFDFAELQISIRWNVPCTYFVYTWLHGEFSISQ